MLAELSEMEGIADDVLYWLGTTSKILERGAHPLDWLERERGHH
jgi:hypothetical protein